MQEHYNPDLSLAESENLRNTDGYYIFANWMVMGIESRADVWLQYLPTNQLFIFMNMR